MCRDCAECEVPGDVDVGEGWGRCAANMVKNLCEPRKGVSRTIGSIADEAASRCRAAQKDMCWCRAHGEFVRGEEPVEDCEEWREP